MKQMYLYAFTVFQRCFIESILENTVKVTAVGIAKFRYNRRNAHIGLSEQAPGLCQAEVLPIF